MKKPIALTALILVFAVSTFAQSWQPSFDGYATAIAASTGDGLLDQLYTSTSEVDYTHGGTPSSVFAGYSGAGYSDARFALVQNQNGWYERHDPVSGQFSIVEDPYGAYAEYAQMNPVTGAVTFQTGNGFFDLKADGSTVAIPAPPRPLSQWSQPDGSDSFVGNNGTYSYLYSGGTWTWIVNPDAASADMLLDGVNPYGQVEYMVGHEENLIYGGGDEFGLKRDGSGWDYFDLGSGIGEYSAPDDQGRVLFVTGGYSEILTIGKPGGTIIANPASMTYGQVGPILVSDGLFVTTFIDGNFGEHAYALSPAAVPEPGPIAVLTLGAVFLCRWPRVRG